MLKIATRTIETWTCGLTAAVALLAVAACEAPTRSTDYRINHPIVVGKETVSMTVAAPAAGAGLAGIEAVKFEQFVRRYLERGQGQMTLQAAAGGDSADRVRALLLKEGVRGGQIAVAPGGNGVTDSVALSYTASTVKVPECSDWSSNATFNWSNRVQSNYGCVTQRNLGLTVRDPADLEKAGEMTGADGEHSAGVITNYRTAPTKAAPKQKSATTSK